MFSVAVCDDDELLCEKIEACLKAYQPQGLVRCESYYSGEKLYADMLRGEAFDLIFLDIELKAMNGGNLGAKIRTELQNRKNAYRLYICRIGVCDGAVRGQAP